MDAVTYHSIAELGSRSGMESSDGYFYLFIFGLDLNYFFSE